MGKRNGIAYERHIGVNPPRICVMEPAIYGCSPGCPTNREFDSLVWRGYSLMVENLDHSPALRVTLTRYLPDKRKTWTFEAQITDQGIG